MTTTHSAPGATATTVPDRPMLINGQWVAAIDGEWSEVASPGRRGTVLARVPVGRPADADRAVTAARAAFPAWRALHFKDRQKALLRIADALDRSREQRVEQIECSAGPDGVILKLKASQDTGLEKWAVEGAAEAFWQVYGKALVVESAPL